MKHVLVTGGNSGIGFALCKKLAIEHGCHVYLGSRSIERGEAAVKTILDQVRNGTTTATSGRVELVQLDTSSDTSVSEAMETIKKSMGGKANLYALVNNAGVGLTTCSDPNVILDTNLYGTKRVCDAFVTLLRPNNGRLVNVGSGAGPIYVENCNRETQKMLFDPVGVTWDWINCHAISALGSEADTMSGYGLSKALVTCYTAVLAREHPNLIVSCVTPGFINTKLTKGYGSTKSPEEGTHPIIKCLFDDLGGSGWYFGSDGLRSPLHFMRNPGDPEYDGKLPF